MWCLKVTTIDVYGNEKQFIQEYDDILDAYRESLICKDIHKDSNYLLIVSIYEKCEKREDKIMAKQELVRTEMVKAMKAKDKPRRETLAMLLGALKNEEINKMRVLSAEEENAVVQKEIKQTKETLDLAPDNRQDIIEECKNRIDVLQQFAPQMMTEKEIKETINSVLQKLSIEQPTKKEKGMIMKNLMPMVKGKADGKLVNQILDSKLV